MYVYLIAHIPGFQNTVIYKFGGNMSRNKYPERTVERILKTSYLLFTKKGYDNVSIQDIVDELGDVTKGAIYHHFKSKDDILAEIFHILCEEYSLEGNLKDTFGDHTPYSQSSFLYKLGKDCTEKLFPSTGSVDTTGNRRRLHER